MKRLLSSILMIISISSFAMDSNSNQPSYNTQLLPSPFPVFVTDSYGVVNHEVPGSQKKMLPTDNSYMSAPGCYIACYSHNPGIYSVSESISVMGQIRVAGEYEGRICQPTDYKGQDISKLQLFKDACANNITGCEDGDCWAGGDTGGWFGIQ